MTHVKTGVVKAYLSGIELNTMKLPPGMIVDNDAELKEDVIALVNETLIAKGKRPFDVEHLRKNMQVLICYS